MKKALCYETHAALMAAHPKAPWHCYGPVHKHGEKLYVQVYLGQHEWLAINVEDVTDGAFDPGWDGTQYGYAYVEEEDVKALIGGCVCCSRANVLPDIAAPERAGKPITQDAWLLSGDVPGGTEKVIAYLGPDDPIAVALSKKEPTT